MADEPTDAAAAEPISPDEVMKALNARASEIPGELGQAFARMAATTAAVRQAVNAETYWNALSSHVRSMDRMGKLLRNWPGEAGILERKTAADSLEKVALMAADVLRALRDLTLDADAVAAVKGRMEAENPRAGDAVLAAIGATSSLRAAPKN